jgi:hypothetical protein
VGESGIAASSGGLIQTGSVIGQEFAEMFSLDGEIVHAVSTASIRNILRKGVNGFMPILHD